jgi:hypothetical protein
VIIPCKFNDSGDHNGNVHIPRAIQANIIPLMEIMAKTFAKMVEFEVLPGSF